jgi:hypothetical protein
MKTPSRGAMGEILLLVCCALAAGVAYGQAEPNQIDKTAGAVGKSKISDAIEKARQDNPESVYYVEQIAHAGAVQAVPMLEEKFARTKEPLDKAKIAQVLIKLGDKDDTYWDYLVRLATPALESDAPDFMNFHSQGKSSPGPSPAFIAWAKAHNVPANGPNGNAAEESVYMSPGKVGLLGLTGDPRAIPLLRQALSSPNHMIEIVAASGLAEMQDNDSIPLIIEACRRAPVEAGAVIAESLVYFDDAEAQRAVDTYVPKDTAKIIREARAQGKKTPFSY